MDNGVKHVVMCLLGILIALVKHLFKPFAHLKKLFVCFLIIEF